MSAKKFNTPFAILGDKVEIPATAQIDGSVSFEQGYPFGYEADYTDPNSKDISRSKTNQLLFDITNAIREIQQGGASEWSEEGKPYKINSLVYAPDGTIKQSLIANNNNDTTHSSWSNLVNAETIGNVAVKLTGNQTIEGIKTFTSSPIVPTPTTDFQVATKKYVDDNAFNMQPTHNESATFTAIDNKIVMNEIVSALSLEVGDVIKFTAGANSQNSRERTVESIINDNEIIVNYEHCGSRGNGSLKLSDEASITCTVKRVAKWFNCSNTLGRAPLPLPYATYMPINSILQNTTGRDMLLSSPLFGFSAFTQYSFDQITWYNVAGANNNSIGSTLMAVIPKDSYYRNVGGYYAAPLTNIIPVR